MTFIRNGARLLEALELTAGQVGFSDEAARQFECRVPLSFVAKMQVGNPADPLLLQVLPVQEELNTVPGYLSDPLQEAGANPIPGLLHKYHGRVLLTAAGACAVNCRYCFRRHFPYQDNNPGTQGWEHALAYIAADASIHEVILSGGDPLMLPDNKLLALAQRCVAIPHVTTLRLHTRYPIVMPERVTDILCGGLQALGVNCVMVVHSNHPNEIDADTKTQLLRLKAAGITLLNQAVLLRGVNDAVEPLLQLSRRCFEAGVLPYYLHVLDKVAGAAHFDVPEHEALRLHQQLQQHLPGYLVPKLVREVPGAKHKVMLTGE